MMSRPNAAVLKDPDPHSQVKTERKLKLRWIPVGLLGRVRTHVVSRALWEGTGLNCQDAWLRLLQAGDAGSPAFTLRMETPVLGAAGLWARPAPPRTRPAPASAATVNSLFLDSSVA